MRRTAALLAVLVLATAASVPAAAHGWRHGHVRFGVFIGAPVLAYGWMYPPPWYVWSYAPPRVVVTASPVYIERDTEGPAPGAWWYYCPEARAYYPYVRDCPGGWQRVPPQPQN
jgi:hypothetical protein